MSAPTLFQNTGAGFTSPTTTKGDLIVRTSSTDVRQGIGANNTLLVADSAQTNGLKWGTFDNVAPTTTKGDLIAFSTTNARFPVGTNAQTIIADSAQTLGVKWGTLQLGGGGTGATTKAGAFDALSPMTTGGDLIYGGASGTGTRLANGNAGQVLTSNGTTTAPSWQAATFTAPTSEHWVYAVNGYGSTNTVIRKWTTVGLSTGSDITYTSDATNGDSWTINATGKYAISYTDDFTSAQNLGISVNSSQLTTNIVSITAADRRAVSQTPGASILTNLSVTLNLTLNDVVRAHTAGTASGSDTNDVMFRISRIG